jgi:fructose-1,6-bisphosphatase I
VNGYTLDASLGEFILTHADVRVLPPPRSPPRSRHAQIKIPPRGKIYSINEGNALFFHPPAVKYLESVKYPANGKPYSARYIGSMVADVHRTLLYGGIFGYPDDKKSKTGKLRLLYEAFPMAFLTEQVRAASLSIAARFQANSRRQAGGVATTGTMRVLDIVPKDIHERTGIWLGSKDDVEDLKKFYE